jgi:predicted RNase H-like HicB family nuclease
VKLVADSNVLLSGSLRRSGRNAIIRPSDLVACEHCVDGRIRDSTASNCRSHAMEHVIQLHIEKLPEGVYLATSDDVQGLVAQGRTIQETIEIARDVARKLIEARSGSDKGTLAPVRESFDYPIIVAT